MADWWENPKNKEEVDRLSWWNHPENKKFFSLPVSVVKDGKWYVASTNSETEKYLGQDLTGCAQGKTEEEALNRLFQVIKWCHEHSEESRLRYGRWVPLKIGPWGHTGGNWFAFFGLNVYFRYGKNMKGGFYIPLTKLNISFTNEWTTYRNWKKERGAV